MFNEDQLRQIQRSLENNLDISYLTQCPAKVMQELVDIALYLDIDFQTTLSICGTDLNKLRKFGNLIDHGATLDEIRQAFKGTKKQISTFVKYHTYGKYIPR